jgi:fructose-1,6-bisphosphatase/inositol monophosphatase family enzyme
MTPEHLVDCFDEAARAVLAAVAPIDAATRRARTNVPGQYALDLIADEAALAVLGKLPVRVVSEESGVHEREGASVTVVLDPVDGSTNFSRGISYWAISICALDADGPLAALVVNQATGQRTSAIRGQGAYRDGAALRASSVARIEDAVVALSGYPEQRLPWKQFRALGCASLMLCDIAAGGLDGLIDSVPNLAPWDYLGGYLACVEAGATVRDANGEELVTDDPRARRQLIAAGTVALADALMPPGSAPA